MKTERKRRMVKMWLNILKPEEEWMWEIVKNWRKRNQLAGAIRDGIALVWSLRNGDLTELDRLFPFVREEMRKTAYVQPPQPSEDFNALIEAVRELQEGRAAPSLPARTPRADLVQVDDTPQKASAKEVAQNFVASVGASWFD